MDFSAYAKSAGTEIDAALSEFATWPDGCPTQLSDAIRYSLLAPGKRLRPLLVLMATEACGSDPQRAMPAACAVEMVHTYSLIHDDLPAMDDDDYRRGQPSCHAKFGEALAILAGDALLARAFEVVAFHTKPPEIAARCCAVLAEAAGAAALVGGQVADLEADQAAAPNIMESQAKDPSPDATPTGGTDVRAADRLSSIHLRKTGALFRACLRMGGLVAEASEAQLASLDVYGARVGLAFQIVDDLLDCSASREDLGKSPGKDQAQGKLTYPALLGEAESRRQAEQLIIEAREALHQFPTSASRLDALAQFVVERTR